ncbi:dihydrolipoamide acetyltransferase family protein [Pseudalkalibacillus berkeleyi]|uniref:Dihydrolipoamide acetyltransferase component of pyruvate dehydrogenase complex n=1 Tax=Pseudalkalibacillus berkeleyi TaxID=1069813 RepID=A0ABS9GX38_9BACL|nr:dihydrolipoamide acetyltransferase family protein [Pseudalkalibacillus berkeleyi]MCF6136245.1 2-oxo acid dehydrogenase subunit E2 [Pseudalkalibacillus berkeleyi]
MNEVKLHDIGEGITEGEITHFHVSPGDSVKIDQPLVEVQTDKVTAELPSPVAGTVKEILASEGDVVTVGTTIILIEKEGSTTETPSNKETGENRPKQDSPKEKKEQSSNAVQTMTRLTRRVLAAPYTRKIARENQVDIEQVNGSGPGGRVTEEDVYQYMNGGQIQTDAESVSEEASTTPVPQAVHPKVEASEIPFKGRRKQIAQKMTQSLYTIPHVSHFDEVDLTNLLDLKKSLKDADPDGSKGMNVSLAAFFVKAIQLAMRDYPIFNAKLDEENEVIRLEGEVNMGLATDADDGLIVPVVKNVEQKSIATINREMKELIQKAKTNKLKPSDMKGGTFTISNVGPLGSTGATPIINHPEVGLMAFHKTKKMPVVINDEIVIRSIMNVSMTFDHRVADGATAVAFTNRFMHYIENPAAMTLELI